MRAWILGVRIVGAILEAVYHSHMVIADEIILQGGTEVGRKDSGKLSSLGAATLEEDRVDPGLERVIPGGVMLGWMAVLPPRHFPALISTKGTGILHLHCTERVMDLSIGGRARTKPQSPGLVAQALCLCLQAVMYVTL